MSIGVGLGRIGGRIVVELIGIGWGLEAIGIELGLKLIGSGLVFQSIGVAMGLEWIGVRMDVGGHWNQFGSDWGGTYWHWVRIGND